MKAGVKFLRDDAMHCGDEWIIDMPIRQNRLASCDVSRFRVPRIFCFCAAYSFIHKLRGRKRLGDDLQGRPTAAPTCFYSTPENFTVISNIGLISLSNEPLHVPPSMKSRILSLLPSIFLGRFSFISFSDE